MLRELPVVLGPERVADLADRARVRFAPPPDLTRGRLLNPARTGLNPTPKTGGQQVVDLDPVRIGQGLEHLAVASA